MTDIHVPTQAEIYKYSGEMQEKEEDSKRFVEPDESYYRSILGPTLGPQMYQVVCERNERRAQTVSKNKQFQKFLVNFFVFVKKRAQELGYRYEDVEISGDSGFTRDGRLLLKVVPKKGVDPIV